MKLEILIPHYKENLNIVKPLLDSIAVQQNINFKDLRVLIMNDGEDCSLELYNLKYPYELKQYTIKHGGIAKCRNELLKKASAEYIMFCDCDDIFYSALGLFLVFREIDTSKPDILISEFIEEGKCKDTKEYVYLTKQKDTIFVHGKVYKLKYIKDNKICFPEKLTVNEDVPFNGLAIALTKNIKYLKTSFYMWKWRDDSTVRKNDNFLYNNFKDYIDSHTILNKELLKRKCVKRATFNINHIIYTSYYMWFDGKFLDNYKDDSEIKKLMKQFILEFEDIFINTNQILKRHILQALQKKYWESDVYLPEMSFTQWIEYILE